MKRILGLLILTYSSTTFGQFSRNDLMLNGTFLLNSELNPHTATSGPTKPLNSFAFKPSVGVFITRNFEIGGQVGYSIINREETYFTSDLYFRSTLFSAGTYGQRYFTLSKKIYFTIFASFTLGSGTDEYISGEGPLPGIVTLDSPNIFQFSTSIRPTVVFFPLPKFGIQGGLGSIRYLYSTNTTEGDKQNDFEINYWPFTIGLSYYIDTK